jgi:phosphoribosylglycinamide formyltransferase 1
MNLAILISGRGSNMEAILTAIEEGKIKNVKPSVVVSDEPSATGLKVAADKFSVPTVALPASGSKGWAYDQKLVNALEGHGVTQNTGLICLAGFMHILSAQFVRRYRMRIMNIHPALLPSFPGLHAQKKAVEYGVKVSGCTVHFVDEGIDSGPILLQRSVPVLDSDTEYELAERILAAEHELYPEAVRLFSKGTIKVRGRRVSIENS